VYSDFVSAQAVKEACEQKKIDDLLLNIEEKLLLAKSLAEKS
jgi:hypothetical protein